MPSFFCGISSTNMASSLAFFDGSRISPNAQRDRANRGILKRKTAELSGRHAMHPHAFAKAVLVAAWPLLICAGAIAAEPKTTEEIVTYRGADRQALIEAGAKKEGRLRFL